MVRTRREGQNQPDSPDEHAGAQAEAVNPPPQSPTNSRRSGRAQVLNPPPPPQEGAGIGQSQADPPPPYQEPIPNVNQTLTNMIQVLNAQQQANLNHQRQMAQQMRQTADILLRMEVNMVRANEQQQLAFNREPVQPPPRVNNLPAPAQANVPPPQHGARTQHLKTSDIKIPKYNGAADTRTPYDFILELEKYQAIVGYNHDEMIQLVIPLALQQDAYNWLRYEPPFLNWQDFKQRFRSEFQAIGYEDDLRLELEHRSQGPNETLSSYIRVIKDYYERLGRPYTDRDLVSRILKQMHPEYRQSLQGKNFETLAQLKQAANEAQELIKRFRTYKPPPTTGTLEPSLSWKPVGKQEPTVAWSDLLSYIWLRWILMLSIMVLKKK